MLLWSLALPRPLLVFSHICTIQQRRRSRRCSTVDQGTTAFASVLLLKASYCVLLIRFCSSWRCRASRQLWKIARHIGKPQNVLIFACSNIGLFHRATCHHVSAVLCAFVCFRKLTAQSSVVNGTAGAENMDVDRVFEAGGLIDSEDHYWRSASGGWAPAKMLHRLLLFIFVRRKYLSTIAWTNIWERRFPVQYTGDLSENSL